jgi:glucoamylase
MHFPLFNAGLVSLLCTQVIAAPSSHLNARSALDDFVTKESAISLQGALDNIGPDGSEVPGAKAGFVVASPSKVNPNCKYSCRPKKLRIELISVRLLHMESRFRLDTKDAH